MNNNTLPSNSSSHGFFLYTQLATGISLAVLSPITITSNVLLLLTISKDPLKCLRAPATYLIVTLALVDLATGLLVEPFFVMYRVASYMQWSPTLGEPCNSLREIAIWCSTVFLSTSFLFVLILCTLPHIIIVNIIFYKKQQTLQESLDLWAANIIADEMMFVKVASDAFLYAWRLTKYRKSLKLVLTCQTHQDESLGLEMTTVTNNT